MMLPVVSVVMPVLNGGDHLCMAVYSIVKQSFQDWELLLLDDGSTDGAVHQVCSTFDDSRIRIVPGEKTLGIATRLNQGVRLARGEFIARMDADDVAMNDRVALQLAMLRGDESLDLIGAGAVAIDDAQRVIGHLPLRLKHDEICAAPWRSFYLPHPTWMGRTRWFLMHPYSEPGPYACEDQDLLLRTFRSSRFACHPESLLAYRIRATTDWAKITRARRALLRSQWNVFREDDNLRNLALATLCFGLRTASDRWKRRRGQAFHPAMATAPSPQALLAWSRTLEAMSDKTCAIAVQGPV